MDKCFWVHRQWNKGQEKFYHSQHFIGTVKGSVTILARHFQGSGRFRGLKMNNNTSSKKVSVQVIRLFVSLCYSNLSIVSSGFFWLHLQSQICRYCSTLHSLPLLFRIHRYCLVNRLHPYKLQGWLFQLFVINKDYCRQLYYLWVYHGFACWRKHIDRLHCFWREAPTNVTTQFCLRAKYILLQY